MKIYVPRLQHFSPKATPDNPHILADMLVEIDYSDLENIIRYWNLAANYTKDTDPCTLWRSVKHVCKHRIKNGSIGSKPFLWRPAITVHCGSQNDADQCKVLFAESMKEVGRLIAENGYNLWYGGGNIGLMGITLEGFNEQLKQKRYRHQYSIQVIPGNFVIGVQSKNGLHPANEGLGTLSDVAIVTPDFVARRDLLDSICTVAIPGPGGIGTKDEIFDVLVHNKTGLRNTLLYLLDLKSPKTGRGCYHYLRMQLEDDIINGIAKTEHLNCIQFMGSPQEIFAALKEKIGRSPHDIFRVNAETYAPHKQSTRRKVRRPSRSPASNP
jgi:uncharacterized protein (TIGR00730 family)